MNGAATKSTKSGGGAVLAAIAVIASGCGSIIEAAKEREPFAFSPTYFGHKLADLPANPTIDQQIGAGRRQVELFREKSDPMLDTDRDLHDYFDSIVQELVKHSPQRPPYPVHAHAADAWTTTVLPLAGGQIIV